MTKAKYFRWLLAILVLIAINAAAPSGERILVNPAMAATCGGLNQKACTIFSGQKVGCRKGFVEKVVALGKGVCVRPGQKARRPSNCGGEGQRPCTIFEAFPSCKKGLVEHFIKGKCVRNSTDIVNLARNTLREVGPMARTTANMMAACSTEMLSAHSRKTSESDMVRLIMDMPCFPAMIREAKADGWETLTIGVASGAALVVGGEKEVGFAFDVGGADPFGYTTSTFKTGLTATVSSGVTIGLLKAPNNRIGGKAIGVVIQGVTAWYDDKGTFVGVSGGVGRSVGVEPATYVEARTELHRLANVPRTSVAEPRDARGDVPYRERPFYPAPRTTNRPGGEGTYTRIFGTPRPAASIAGSDVSAALPDSVIGLCNASQNPNVIRVGYAFLDPENPGQWQALGWYSAPMGQCHDRTLPRMANGRPYEGALRLFAVRPATKDRWGDTGTGGKICADANSYTIFRHKDAAKMRCSGKDFVLTGTFEMTIEAGVRNTFTFSD